VVLDLARPWIIPVRTVVVMGNAGDRSFSSPAGPGYTECRPSYAGQLVLDAEARRLGIASDRTAWIARKLSQTVGHPLWTLRREDDQRQSGTPDVT
jgi:hypothetical protein